ncbi:MAG TPA: M20/M25/M40 family metallo-hydrolase [Candidatus Acidoferrum sp.]|nr:M20/M25/M40 family metallo-hydrolase [Candidatus Acidoferrum sp.]
MNREQVKPHPARLLALAFAAAGALTLLAAGGQLAQVSHEAKDTRFTAQEFLEPIKFLASDELKGRGNGTLELDRAAEYIAQRFRKFGLKASGDDHSFFQRFSLVVGAKLGGKNSATFAQGTSSTPLKVSQDYVPLSFSANTTVTAPLVFSGYGITAPEYHYDDYEGLDVNGKAVIVLRHEPQENDEHSVFLGKQLTAHAEIVNKAINARNHGAAAMILVRDLGNHPDQSDELLRFEEISGPQEMSIPVIQVKVDEVNRWLKPSGQTIDDLRQAIDKDLSNHSAPLEASARLKLSVDIERIHRAVSNVVGVLPGSDASLAGQYIVVGAHYDHLGLGDQNSLAPSQRGQVHHGADDNASGVSGVLELADVLSHTSPRPRHSIVLVNFAGEELGLLGSAYYTEHPPFPINQTIAMINLDMIGRVANNRLYVSGTGTSPGFQQIAQDANRALGFDLNYSASGYGASDHTSFTTHEVPVFFFFSGLHSDYHKPSDTWDKIDAANGARVVELVSNVVAGLDALNEKPQYVRVAEPATSITGGGGGYGPYFGSIPDFGQVEHGGVKFADVRDGSPAGKAGFKAGDVLIEFDGKPIDNLYDFTYALRAHKAGDKVIVTVLRGNEKITREVTLEARK